MALISVLQKKSNSLISAALSVVQNELSWFKFNDSKMATLQE